MKTKLKYFPLVLELLLCLAHLAKDQVSLGGCHGRECMVVGFTTTYAISAYHH